MSYKTHFSECRDPENRSRKLCCCGGHSTRARKKRKPGRDRLATKLNLSRGSAISCSIGAFVALVTPPMGG